MKVLLDSHATVTQSSSGGLQVRIKEHERSLNKKGLKCKLFNKWDDKIEDYDIYHLIKVSKDSYNEVLFAKQKNKKIVVSAVVPIIGSMKISVSLLLANLLKLPLPHEFIRKTLLLADVVTTETSEERRFISKNYKIPIDKIVTIPNGVNERFFNDCDLGVSFKDKFKIDKPFILQVGRIDSNKNQLNLIRAFKDSEIPVVFIGGPYLSEMEYYERCKSELSDNMIMTGWIDHNSDLMLSAYREAEVVVLPSNYETFGNVIIEAGVSGTKVSCSNTLPINEYRISRHWSKFNPNDLSDIYKAVLQEFNKRHSKEVREEFISTFSWDNIMDKYIEIYKQ